MSSGHCHPIIESRGHRPKTEISLSLSLFRSFFFLCVCVCYVPSFPSTTCCSVQLAAFCRSNGGCNSIHHLGFRTNRSPQKFFFVVVAVKGKIVAALFSSTDRLTNFFCPLDFRAVLGDAPALISRRMKWKLCNRRVGAAVDDRQSRGEKTKKKKKKKKKKQRKVRPARLVGVATRPAGPRVVPPRGENGTRRVHWSDDVPMLLSLLAQSDRLSVECVIRCRPRSSSPVSNTPARPSRESNLSFQKLF